MNEADSPVNDISEVAFNKPRSFKDAEAGMPVSQRPPFIYAAIEERISTAVSSAELIHDDDFKLDLGLPLVLMLLQNVLLQVSLIFRPKRSSLTSEPDVILFHRFFVCIVLGASWRHFNFIRSRHRHSERSSRLDTRTAYALRQR